ncbi:MAG: arsenate reductase (glutaredoxin) [Putridiphycobacter sp.]
MKIYHNPRCSKSRNTLNIINENGQEVTVVEYLKTPPSKAELKELLKKLNIPAEKLIRKGEADFKENFKGKTLSEDEWIDAMVAYPKLIERPIVVNGDKAVIGRPPENVLEII